MTKKRERVPGMRSNAPNRAQRRGHEPAEDQPLARDVPEPEQPDVTSAPAKSSGRRKKTAENWNQ